MEINRVYGTINKFSESEEEILHELRYRIYKLMKNHVHVKHDNNECTSDVVRALKAVCNICMDHINQPICFGEYSNIFVGNHSYLEMLHKLSGIPLLGGLFSSTLASKIFFEYQFLETLTSCAIDISEELNDIPM